MTEWPTGTVTFLFTDIEGSTRLWEQHAPAMRLMLVHHDGLLKASIAACRGHIFKTIGDAFCAAFASERDAVEAALAAQEALQRETPRLRVRMAVHTGEADFRDGDYFGPALNRVARLLAAGHGGQVLLSQATADRIGSSLPEDTHLRLLGAHRLRDIAMREIIFQLLAPGLPSDFPPLNTLDVAFRRGLRRAAAVSLAVIAVMAGLTAWALTEAHRSHVASQDERQARLQAVSLAALSQTKQGVQQLEAGNGLGLLDLLQARETAEPLPDLKAAIATVWAGWHQAYAGRLVSAVGHHGQVRALAFSPDGTRLATASEDRTAKLWDARTWQLAAPPLQHDSAVDLVAFSPDGKLLATAAGNRAWLWDTATGRPHGGPMQHGDLAASVAFSSDGKLLASASGDGTVSLWDMETGRPRHRSLRPDAGLARLRGEPVSVGFGPLPGGPLVTATQRSISLWDTATGEPLGLLLRRARPSAIYPVLGFGRDGVVRAIASDTTVWLWEAALRRFRGDLLLHSGPVQHLALSPDGRLLATAGPGEPAVHLWETATGNRSMPPLMHPTSVDGLAFGPPGSKLLVTLSKGVVRFWDTSTGQPYPEPSPTPGGVRSLALSPDGQTLATAGANGTVQLWAVAASPPYRRLPPQPSEVLCTAFQEDRPVLATYSDDGLRLWSAETGQLLGPPAGVPGQSMGGTFSQDGRLLANWSGRDVSLWQTSTGRPVGRPLRLSQRAHLAALSDHGAVLATISGYDTVQLWDTKSGRPRGQLLHHPPSVVRLEFSPDERLLATAGGDSVRVWETATSRLHVPSIRLAGTPRWVAFSPDGRLLAVTTWAGGAVTLWSTATGRPFLHPLEHPAPVSGGAFSPDGKRLATIADDNAARLWNLASGRPDGRPMAHPDEVQEVRFSADGKRLATASFSGARLWDAATCQLAGRPLLIREPVSEVQFGLNGQVMALRTDHTVYLWRLPAAPAGLPAMRLLTEVALGVAPRPDESDEVLPWQTWRRLREEVQRQATTGDRGPRRRVPQAVNDHHPLRGYPAVGKGP